MLAKWNDVIYVVAAIDQNGDFFDIRPFSSVEIAKEEFCSVMDTLWDEDEYENASSMGDYLPKEWMYDAIMNEDLSGWEEAGYPEGKAWIYSVENNEVKCKIYEFDPETKKMTLAYTCVLHAGSLDQPSIHLFSVDYARNEFKPFSKDTWEWNDGNTIRHYSIYPETKESKGKREEEWKVCVRTSLPDVCYDEGDLEETIITADSFEKAKEIFQDTLKKYAFSENAMFDGKGRIKNLNNHCAFWSKGTHDSEEGDSDSDDFDDFDDLDDFGDFKLFNTSNLHREDAQKIQEALARAFSGETVNVEEAFPWKQRTDTMIEIIINEGVLCISTGNDGYLNGVEPRIEANIFDMTEPKHYYVYIDDLLGVDTSAELYMDLVRA